MPFEEFDDRIREAAQNHHPAYDEKAWAGMEQKLDKHLPVEKEDRRRILPFILFLLLAGSAALLLYKKPWQPHQKTQASAAQTTNPSGHSTAPVNEALNPAEPANASGSATNTSSEQATPNRNNPEKADADKNQMVSTAPSTVNNQQPGTVSVLKASTTSNPPVTVAPPVKQSGKTNPVFAMKVNQSGVIRKKAENRNTKRNENKEPGLVDQTKNTKAGLPADPATKTIVPSVEQPADQIKEVTSLPVPATDSTVIKIAANTDTAGTTPVQEPVISQTKNTRNKKKPAFFIALSAGPDLSGVSFSRLGNATLAYGIGAGLRIQNRLIIRTGFYTAKKIYAADSADYNPPAGWWRYYPHMQKIDADCRVYEVPLLLSYSFGQKKSHGWLATAGISSVYMKRETYTYNYKYFNTPISKTVTFRDDNKHFLSLLTLSGGYVWKPSSRFTLLAEPYLKLPLGGIGFGKIKLKGTGVLFSVAYNPFARK